MLDPGETVTVTLSDATTTVGTADVDATAREATTTIMDDGTETVSVAAAAETVPEGTAAQFTVTLSGAVANNVTLNWRTTDDGTATAGEDYTAVMDGTVTFVSGESLTQTISVTTLQDTPELDERWPSESEPRDGEVHGDEPVVVSYTLGGTATAGDALGSGLPISIPTLTDSVLGGE